MNPMARWGDQGRYEGKDGDCHTGMTGRRKIVYGRRKHERVELGEAQGGTTRTADQGDQQAGREVAPRALVCGVHAEHGDDHAQEPEGGTQCAVHVWER